MASILVIIAILYAVYSLSIPFYGNNTGQVDRLDEDIKMEIERGGAWGFICRLIQPIIWILTLPFVSLGAALGFATILLLIGMIF